MNQLIVKELSEVLLVIFSFLYRQKKNKKARSFASLGHVCLRFTSSSLRQIAKEPKGVRTYTNC